jgi:hypothetical protein
MTSLKLKSWILLAGLLLSPLTIHATTNKDSSFNSVDHKKSYNFISIDKVGSSFSDYISRSLSGARWSSDGVSHDNRNIYSASFGHLVPGMVSMINYRTFTGFDYKLFTDGKESVNTASYSVNDTSSFASFVNSPRTFRSISEPKTYGMLLAGLGLMVFATRRRRIG